jgi:hypothetical protein
VVEQRGGVRWRLEFEARSGSAALVLDSDPGSRRGAGFPGAWAVVSMRCWRLFSLVRTVLLAECLLSCASQQHNGCREPAATPLEKPSPEPQVEAGMTRKIPSDLFPLPDEPEEPAPGPWRSDWIVEVSADRRRRWEMPDGTWELEMPNGKWRCAVSPIRAEFHSVSQEREESARDADETCPDPEKRRARGVGATEEQCRGVHAISAQWADVGLGDRYWEISRTLACSADAWESFVWTSASFKVDETGKQEVPAEEVLSLKHAAGRNSVTVYLRSPWLHSR